MAYYITKACTNCAACVFECPTGSITEGIDRHVIDTDTCADHAACAAVCPVDAIVPFDRVNPPAEAPPPRKPSSA